MVTPTYRVPIDLYNPNHVYMCTCMANTLGGRVHVYMYVKVFIDSPNWFTAYNSSNTSFFIPKEGHQPVCVCVCVVVVCDV